MLGVWLAGGTEAQGGAGAEVVAGLGALLGWRMWRMGVVVTSSTVTVRGLVVDHQAPRAQVVGIRAYRVPVVWAVLFRVWGAVEWQTGSGYARRFGAGLWFGGYDDARDFVRRVQQALDTTPPSEGPARGRVGRR